MKIETLKELEKVIQVCRKHGVASIKLDGIELSLGPMPVKASKQSAIEFNPDPLADAKVPQYTPMNTFDIRGINGPQVHQETAQETVSRIKEELTEEQLMFYSAVGPTDHMTSEQ